MRTFVLLALALAACGGSLPPRAVEPRAEPEPAAPRALEARRLAGPFEDACDAARAVVEDGGWLECEGLFDEPPEGDEERPYAHPTARLEPSAPPFLDAWFLEVKIDWELASCALVVRTASGWFVDAEGAVQCRNSGSEHVGASAELEAAPIGPDGQARLVARVSRSSFHHIDGGEEVVDTMVCAASEGVSCATLLTHVRRVGPDPCINDPDACDEDAEPEETSYEAPVRFEPMDRLVVGDYARRDGAAPEPGTYRLAFP